MTGIESLSELMDRVRRFTDQTSVDLYDLLPIEDREAIEWVREHGGIEAVKKRLMPEGMEWPRFEDGRQVKFRDEGVDVHGETRSVEGVKFSQNGFVFISDGMGVTWWANDRGPIEEAEVDPGKRVKRPAPKVLDADGVEIELGDDLYSVGGSLKFHVSHIDRAKGKIATDAMFAIDKWADPSLFTHQRPVLDAEGNRIEPAMDVWWICEGDERGVHAEKLHVESIGEDGLVTCDPFNGGTWAELEPSELYVHEPALDADGVPIHEDDTVWLTDGRGPWKVSRIVCADRRRIICDDDENGHLNVYPEQLTHERPDSWERLEEDCAKSDVDYCAERGLLDSSCDVVEGDGSTRHCTDCGCTCGEKMARDIVRRAKALAERDR